MTTHHKKRQQKDIFWGKCTTISLCALFMSNMVPVEIVSLKIVEMQITKILDLDRFAPTAFGQ